MEKVSMITASNFLSRIPPLFSDLSKIMLGDIDCTHTTLTRYSTDGSPYAVLPQAVMYPKNATDIKHILSFAREYMMPVTVRGKGTARSGGSLGEGIIIDMCRYFSQIRSVNMVENIVTVDAGVTIGELLGKLHAWNVDLPFITVGESESTVGGLVATKSIHTGSYRHGSTREWIESLTVVIDNGEEHILSDGITPSGRLLGIYQDIFPLFTKETGVIRAAKPSSHDDAMGYNIWNPTIGPRQLIDVLSGSEGTLGIITSITFRTSPYKKYSITSCIPITDTNCLPVYIEIAKRHGSEAMFLYDHTVLELAEKYYPTLVPFFIDTPYVLLVTHTHSDVEKLHQAIRMYTRALPIDEHTIKTLVGTDVTKRILEGNFCSSLGDRYTNGTLTPITIADGLIVEVSLLPSFLKDLEEYLDSLGRLYMITGAVGSGHISVTILFDPKTESYEDDILHYGEAVFSLVQDYKGGISSAGGDGLARTPYLSYMYNDAMLSVFRRLQQAFDPLAICNPGKKVTITTTYLKEHIRR